MVRCVDNKYVKCFIENYNSPYTLSIERTDMAVLLCVRIIVRRNSYCVTKCYNGMFLYPSWYSRYKVSQFFLMSPVPLSRKSRSETPHVAGFSSSKKYRYSDNEFEHFDFPAVEGNMYRSRSAISRSLTGKNSRERGNMCRSMILKCGLSLRLKRKGYVLKSQQAN